MSDPTPKQGVFIDQDAFDGIVEHRRKYLFLERAGRNEIGPGDLLTITSVGHVRTIDVWVTDIQTTGTHLIVSIMPTSPPPDGTTTFPDDGMVLVAIRVPAPTDLIAEITSAIGSAWPGTETHHNDGWVLFTRRHP